METIEVEMDADDLTFSVFLRLANEMRLAIDEYTESVVGKGQIRWILETVSKASPARLAIAPHRTPGSDLRDDDLDSLARGFDSGVRALALQAVRPPHFTDAVLEHVRKMGSMTGVDAVRIGSQGRVDLTSQIVANIDALLAPAVTTLGTVEGRLESVNLHDGRRVFSIYDLLTGDRIGCKFGRRVEIDDVREALDRRVAVYGEILQSSSGKITSVNASTIDVLPSEEELPPASAAFGILREQGR